MGAKEIIIDIWNGFWDTLNYIFYHGDVVAFIVLAGLAIAAALYVVKDKEIVHSAFYLAFVFTCVGFTFFFLDAEFLGVMQLLVYVGAITILFAFSVMLTKRTIIGGEDDDE